MTFLLISARRVLLILPGIYRQLFWIFTIVPYVAIFSDIPLITVNIVGFLIWMER